MVMPKCLSSIVQKHPPLVYGACLRILEDWNKRGPLFKDVFFYNRIT
jgi:hypothetical protein